MFLLGIKLYFFSCKTLKLLVNTDPAAAKAAFQFSVNHEDVVEGLTEFGQAQGWL